MLEKEVFWGFREGPIAFPPSYRWKRGADPGDYTDAAYLKAHAYTTNVAEVTTAEGNFSSTLMELPEVVNDESDGMAQSQSSGPPKPTTGQPASTSIRTPSYTDRVLTHSLDGCSPLIWGRYDLVQSVTLSDHRPVVATLEMPVSEPLKILLPPPGRWW